MNPEPETRNPNYPTIQAPNPTPDKASHNSSLFARQRAAVERTRHIKDSQSQILALAFRGKTFNTLKACPLRTEAGARGRADGRRCVFTSLLEGLGLKQNYSAEL